MTTINAAVHALAVVGDDDLYRTWQCVACSYEVAVEIINPEQSSRQMIVVDPGQAGVDHPDALLIPDAAILDDVAEVLDAAAAAERVHLVGQRRRPRAARRGPRLHRRSPRPSRRLTPIEVADAFAAELDQQDQVDALTRPRWTLRAVLKAFGVACMYLAGLPAWGLLAYAVFCLFRRGGA